MRKLLVFQHAATEPLGVLDPMLRRWGFRIRYVNFARDPQARPDVGRYNGLVVLGGPMNVDPARESLNAMAASRARASAAGATDGRSFAIWLLRRR